MRDNLGLTLMALGRTQEAVEQFQEALRIDPSFEKARQNLERAQRRP
jgi:tetratricopeptide (TPR) repeat protein